jgi:hypothetical protein
MEDSLTVYSKTGEIIFDSSGQPVIPAKKKGLKIKKNIEHPILDNMRQYNTDGFWDIFLMKASRGNFPKGFSYKDNTLYYSMKSKYNFQVTLTPSDIEKSLDTFKHFVQDKGILSDLDKSKMNYECSKIEPITESWKQLGKMQTNCIYSHISKLETDLKLDQTEKTNLKSIIKIGVSSGYFNNTNIIVEGSSIVDIEPLLWNRATRTFSIDAENIKIKRQKVSRQKMNDFSSDNTTTCLDFDKNYTISNVDKKWEKFLSQIFKVEPID